MPMTPDHIIALRQPFPNEMVGKLPKTFCKACSQAQNRRCNSHQWLSNCPECHGSHSTGTLHLDYVGHAAVTDRLLAVDPLWSWEPLALGPDGLPAQDRDGNLWIRLTIHGTTRLGVGDGKNAKERIGDAIRNAAMRFGVALDLWAKDQLVEFKAAAAEGRIVVDQAPTADFGEAPAPAEAKVTKPQLTKINIELRRLAITDADVALALYANVVGHPVESTKDLTEAEAREVLARLADMKPTADDKAAAK